MLFFLQFKSLLSFHARKQTLLPLRALQAAGGSAAHRFTHLSTGWWFGSASVFQWFPPKKIGTKIGFNPIDAPGKHRECFPARGEKRDSSFSRICAGIQQWFEVLGFEVLATLSLWWLLRVFPGREHSGIISKGLFPGWQLCSAQGRADTAFPHSWGRQILWFFQSKGPSPTIHGHTLMFVWLFFFSLPQICPRKRHFSWALSPQWCIK